MKVKYGQLRGAVDVLKKLGDTTDLRASTSFRIARIISAASADLERIESERMKAVKKYGVTKEDGEVTVIPENMEAFREEMNELLKLETELPGQKFKPEDFDGAKLSPFDFTLIEFLIEE